MTGKGFVFISNHLISVLFHISNEKVSCEQDRDVWKIATQCIFVGPLVHCIDRNLHWLMLKHM